MLQVNNLTKKFGRHMALCEINFALLHGETVGIIGESGAGKSTLLRCILGLEKIDKGEIFFHNNNIGHLKKHKFLPLRKKIQIVWQDPYNYLNPYRKVLEQIQEPLENFCVGTTVQRKKKSQEILEQVGLEQKLGQHYPHQLSGGQSQRVVIARALVLKPELLLFDEAVSALDIYTQMQIIELLKNLQQELNLTYLFVSHDLQIVRHLCHKVMVLFRGKMVESGNTREIYQNPSHNYTRNLLKNALRLL